MCMKSLSSTKAWLVFVFICTIDHNELKFSAGKAENSGLSGVDFWGWSRDLLSAKFNQNKRP